MKLHYTVLYLYLVVSVLYGCTGEKADKESLLERERPAKWAMPLEIDGVPNLHKVSDGLYRSAQPTSVGMKRLKGLGIKTVVNLRSFHSDRDEIGDTGLEYEHITVKAWHPEEKEMIRFLRIVSDPAKTPVLVHCQHGADRTGIMSAIYRVVLDGWSKDEALQEMTEGGFGFHEIWVNLVPWFKGLDIERITRESGLGGSGKGLRQESS